MLGADGSYYGPANLAMLDQWAKEGRIVADTVLVEQGTNRQVHARDLPSLSHHFQLAPRPQQLTATQLPYQPPSSGYQPPSTPYQQSPYPRGGPQMAYMGPRKNKVLAAVLAFFLGGFGVHRFYLGHTMVGITMLLLSTLGYFLCCIGPIVSGVWAIVDFVLILVGQLRDADGRALE